MFRIHIFEVIRVTVVTVNKVDAALDLLLGQQLLINISLLCGYGQALSRETREKALC